MVWPLSRRRIGQVVRVGHFVGGDQDRPGRREGVERLADHPLLAVLLELPVAGGDIVADGVAGDVLAGASPAQMCRPRLPTTMTSSAS